MLSCQQKHKQKLKARYIDNREEILAGQPEFNKESQQTADIQEDQSTSCTCKLRTA